MEVDALVQLLARILDNDDVKNFIRFQKLMVEKSKRSDSELTSLKPSSRRSSSRSHISTTTPQTDTNGAKISSTKEIEKSSSPSPNIPSEPNDEAKLNTQTKTLTKSSRRDSSRTKLDRRTDHAYLTYDFTYFDWSNEKENIPLSSLSITDQQNVLIDDLLHVLVVSFFLTLFT
jgi:hypothetical protein